jgi:hypothetical protein
MENYSVFYVLTKHNLNTIRYSVQCNVSTIYCFRQQ